MPGLKHGNHSLHWKRLAWYISKKVFWLQGLFGVVQANPGLVDRRKMLRLVFKVQCLSSTMVLSCTISLQKLLRSRQNKLSEPQRAVTSSLLNIFSLKWIMTPA